MATTITITLSDETAAELSVQAQMLGVTMQELLGPVAEQLANARKLSNSVAPTPTAPVLPYDEWKRLLDEMLVRYRARADQYPPGFAADVSRESIYEGCGE
jgi:hypothetical protein